MTDRKSKPPADVEVCTVETIGLKISGEDAPEIIAAINKYLSIFAKPIVREKADGVLFGDHECLNCGKVLNGLMGSFQWGIRSGEGTCTKCGWPARAMHRPKLGKEEIFNKAFEIILQYHPDQVVNIANNGGIKPKGGLA